MNFLTKLAVKQNLKNLALSQRVVFNSSSSQYVPGVSDEKINKWLSSLTSRASSSESKGYCTQLSSIIHFFNRKVESSSQKIDWKAWSSEITTKGFVENLQKNFTQLNSQQYNVEAICKNVVGTQSKELQELENELTFHGAVWMNAYSDYTMFLFDLEDYGNSTEYMMHENYDFFYGLESELEELTETHNYFAGSKDDINLRSYIACQFNWGKKVISFYRHPADDFKCGKCTKNILGR